MAVTQVSQDQVVFMAKLEEYYDQFYSNAMKDQVVRLLPKRRDTLAELYQILIRDESAWKRAIRVPGVDAFERALSELSEQRAIASSPVALLEDHGATPTNDGFEMLQAITRALGEGRDPRTDERVTEILERHGVAL